MVHEYALEPDVLSTWDKFRYFMEQFGVEHGRLISQFPKKWKRYVIEACADTEINRKRIEVRLRSIDDRLIRSGRPYDPKQSWLVNAITQHGQNPFHAIIARQNPVNHADVIKADDVSDSTPKWAVRARKRVRRSAMDLAEAIAPLIRISKKVVLVDPYFRPTERRYQRSLGAILRTGWHSGIERIEIHCRTLGNPTEMWENDCRRAFLPCLPNGVAVTLVRWRERDGGETMHARYVLTERGGLHIDYGLDEGNGNQTTDISLLSQADSAERLRDYETPISPFDEVDRITLRR